MTVSQVVPEPASAASDRSAAAACSHTAKVVADINFLQDRIAAVKSQRSPNRAVLDTYTSMLARRELALKLLQGTATGTEQTLDSAG